MMKALHDAEECSDESGAIIDGSTSDEPEERGEESGMSLRTNQIELETCNQLTSTDQEAQ